MYPFLADLAKKRVLILASASPRRVALLRELNLPFSQEPADIEEIRRTGETPSGYAIRLAREKGEAVLTRHAQMSEVVVLGCDTVVSIDQTLFEKPATAEHAISMLRDLSGREHLVTTALALISPARRVFGCEQTAVTFKRYDEAAIATYVATGEPMDKAGAYGIQGMGAFLVDSLRGNLDTVIGLPRVLLNRLAEEFLQQT